MSDSVESKVWTEEEQEQLRAEVRKVAANRPMTVVAKLADVAYGTWSSWMGKTYAGNTSRVADAARKWLDGEATRAQTRAVAPKEPGFIDTKTAGAIISALETAQYEPDFVLIAGGAGVGKTTACLKHQAANPNVFILTGEPCFNTPRMLLDCLAQALELTERYSAQTVSRAIQKRLKGSGGLVIVDEAQHLSTQGLDQMRSLFDLTGVGFALVGNETVYSRLEGHSRQAHFAQLYSRVGLRVQRPAPYAADITQMIEAWGVSGDNERQVLTAIAKKPGSLRNLTKTMKRATMLANGGSVTLDLIARAWEAISNTKVVLTQEAV